MYYHYKKPQPTNIRRIMNMPGDKSDLSPSDPNAQAPRHEERPQSSGNIRISHRRHHILNIAAGSESAESGGKSKLLRMPSIRNPTTIVRKSLAQSNIVSLSTIAWSKSPRSLGLKWAKDFDTPESYKDGRAFIVDYVKQSIASFSNWLSQA